MTYVKEKTSNLALYAYVVRNLLVQHKLTQ